MTDRILALVDDSIYAESVCRHAEWVARRLDAPVEVMHVLGPREAAGQADLSGALQLGARTSILNALATLDEQRGKLALARGHAILEDAKAILEANGAGPVSVSLRRDDLLGAATEPGLRAIVMGKRGGASAYAAEHLGSNLERVARAVTVPLLVASREFRPIAKVMVAWDASPSAEAAVTRIAASPVFAGLDVSLVHVGERTGPMAAKMEASAERLRSAGLAVATDVVSGEREATLERVLEAGGYDLLVMGAYGHGRLRRLIIGSTTAAMMRVCSSAIILFR